MATSNSKNIAEFLNGDTTITTTDIADDAVTADKLANAINTSIAVGSTANTTANAALPKAGGTMTGNTLHGDSVKDTYGTGADLEIYHDGSDSYIKDTGTGSLWVASNEFRVANAAVTANMIIATQSAAVKLYHNNALKLETTADGIDVTGSVTNATNVAKVWIKFDGQGQTIDASYNVSSLGDWGTGNYGVYIATDINTNYSAMVGTTQAQIGSVQLNNTQPNGGRCDVRVDTHSGSAVDPQHVFLTIHGEDS